MDVIEYKPIPIYEVTCCECKSVIRYKKHEVYWCQIKCPVCNVSLWANTIHPVDFESVNNIPPSPPTTGSNIYKDIKKKHGKI